MCYNVFKGFILKSHFFFISLQIFFVSMKAHFFAYPFLIVLCLLLSSCMKKDDLKFGNIGIDDNFSYDLPIPLVDAHLTMANLLEKIPRTLLTTDADGLLHVVYRIESDFTVPPLELGAQSFSISLPDLPVAPFTANTWTAPPIACSAQFNTGGDMRVDTAKVGSMRGQFLIRTGIKNSGVFKFICRSFIDSMGKPLEISETLPGITGGRSTQSILVNLNLENYRIVPDNSDPNNLQRLNFEFIPTLNKDEAIQEMYSAMTAITLEIEPCSPDWAYGFLGQQTLGPVENFLEIPILHKFSMEELEVLKADMKLNISNAIGVPLELNANVTTYTQKTEKTMSVSEQIGCPRNPFDLPVDSVFEEEFQELINNDLGDLPTKVGFNVEVMTNPYTDPNDLSSLNFFKQGAVMKFSVGADIPLRLRTKKLTITDTMTFAGLPVASEGVEFFTIKANIHNAFPMDAIITLYFLDKNMQKTDSVTFDRIAAAPVNPVDFHVVEPAVTQVNVLLSQQQIEHLTDTRFFLIKGVMNTSDQGSKIVGIYENSEKEGYLKVMLGCRIKANGKIISSLKNEE